MNGIMGFEHLNIKMLKSLDEVLRCPICSEFFNSCVMTSCGHDFCSVCIKRRMTTEPDCPICYEDLRERDLRINDSMDKIVRIYKKLTSLDFLFCVVEFPKEDQPPSVVPSAWLENDNEVMWCWFPTKDFRKHVLKRSSPEAGWDLFQANVLHFSRERKDSDDYLKQHQRGISSRTSELESTPEKLKTSSPEEAKLNSSITSSSSPQAKVLTTPNLLQTGMQHSLHTAHTEVLLSTNLQQAQLLACGSCDANSDLVNKVMMKLDYISEQINGMKKTFAICADGDNVQVEKMEIAHLPLGSVSALNNFNSLIENQKEFRKYVKYLGKLGGRNVKQITRKILSSLINYSFAVKMNWIGVLEKTGLKNYPRVVQLITAAVRETPVSAEAKQLEIEYIIKTWLRCAVDRKGAGLK